MKLAPLPLPQPKLLTTRLELYPKQALAMFSRAQEKLYGGAAAGGKSHLLRVRLIYLALAVSGFQGFLFRRIFPDLITNHMRGPKSFPMLLADMVVARLCRILFKTILFFNGSRINLCHCQYEKTVYSYQGAEIHGLAIDEATHFTETMYRFLRGRCRVSGLVVPANITLPDITLSANPGGIGHTWVKRTFVDNGPLNLVQASDEEGGMLREYIPAKLTDNPSMLVDDPTYERRLEGLGDKMLVRAMKDGDWNVVPGAKFGQVWRKERHVRTAFKIPEAWEIWRGADDGYASPAACYWITQNPDTKTYYVIQELYRAGMRPEFYGEQVIRMDKEIELTTPAGPKMNDHSLQGLLDSAAFSDTGAGNVKITRGDQINSKGCSFRPVEKFPGSKIARVQNLLRLLDVNPLDPEKGPGIVFFDCCVEAIRTIPIIPTNPRDPEDTDPAWPEDHAFDGVTYGLQWRKLTFKKRRLGGI
jgi:hypothetical protein